MVFKNIRNRIDYWLRRQYRPGMIYGIDHKGRKLADSRISNTTVIENPDQLDLGDNVFIGHHNFIEASNGISIGEGCQITNFISIISHSSHQSIRLYGKEYRKHKEHHGYLKGPVNIGPYSFVGPHCVIMPNTNIGKGSIVQAFSMVKGEFPDFSIIGGNPAKVQGSTKDMDEKFLSDYPELNALYKEWAERKE